MTSMAMSSYQMVNLANGMLCWDLVILHIIYDHIMDPNGNGLCMVYDAVFTTIVSNDPIGI
jgi:hypothetical protein